MRDHITLQVARYLPEKQSEPTFDEHEVPCPKDWVVLDGLNYIKDRIDGTLSYRWSCRMGICGSCGMTVNGEPKLTCATFLSDYAPGPLRIEPLRNFPIIRDLIVDIGDFMLDVADTIVNAAYLREESRGAHQRTDFPKRDDVRFLSHSLAYRNPDGSARVEYAPATITRWPPAERVYGEAAAHAGSHHAAGSSLPAGETV